jgi:histidine triad (HIT) family protein
MEAIKVPCHSLFPEIPGEHRSLTIASVREIMSDCLFCKIVAGDIPADKLYEDDDILAFSDISPQAPKHFLVIPKKHLVDFSSIQEADEKLMGKMLRKSAEIAAENGIEDGFRAVVNNGANAGQLVFHVHMHILGGRPMNWPPG